MQFVNIHGKEMFTSGTPSPQSKVRSASKPPRTSYHDGYLVLGHPPDAIEAARIAAGESFDLQQYLRNATPKRVRSKPYELISAAELCAQMAGRAGWQGVRVQAKSKGEL